MRMCEASQSFLVTLQLLVQPGQSKKMAHTNNGAQPVCTTVKSLLGIIAAVPHICGVCMECLQLHCPKHYTLAINI